MGWRNRFLEPAVRLAFVAKDRTDRGVIITDKDGVFQAYAWNRAAGSLRQLSDSKTSVLITGISPDGRWIYVMVDDEPGTEVGHLHRIPFEGGESEDLTPGLDPYTTSGLRTSPGGVVSIGGISGAPVILVADERGARSFEMPGIVFDLALSADGARAAVSGATPGEGLVPTARLIDVADGTVLAVGDRMRAGAIHGDLVAVGAVEGDWIRPGLWNGVTVTPIDVEVEGDVMPIDWSADGETILLEQTYRARLSLFFYHRSTGEVAGLSTPPGAGQPFAELMGSNTALCVWSGISHPGRVFECSSASHRQALVLEGERDFSGVEWEEFTFPSTEGAEIQGWLLRPPGEGPWPTVLFTHGGPTSVANPSFSPLGSAWLDQGFAVASINYRGSTTFGEAFRESLTFRIGGPDVDDVVAARQWLVDQGIADPDRIVKNGYSYGGYLTLQSLGTHPDLWAAGVAGAPIADWTTLYEDENDVLKAVHRSLFGGTPDETAEAHLKASPRTYAPYYEAPLFISTPENDSRTPIRQVELFVDDLRSHGKDVELDLLKGGHAGSSKDQAIAMVEKWLAFGTAVVGLAEEGGGSHHG